MRTKTERGKRCETIDVAAARALDLCPLPRLQVLVVACVQWDVPNAGEGAAFRAYGHVRSKGPVKTTAFQNRLQTALRKHGTAEDRAAGYAFAQFPSRALAGGGTPWVHEC